MHLLIAHCWAHLIRDIRFLKKLPDETTKVWAEQLEDRSRRLFQAWHSRETMTDEGFRRSMMIHRDRFLELVRNPPSSKEANNLAARFAIREYIVEGSDEVQSYDMSQVSTLHSERRSHHARPMQKYDFYRVAFNFWMTAFSACTLSGLGSIVDS